MSTYAASAIDGRPAVYAGRNRKATDRSDVRSDPKVAAARLLAVLVVALTVTSIVGLTLVGDHGTTAALVAGVIGMSSAVLGLVFGFLKAYQHD